ncbi:hypothetical protein ACFXJ5_28105 [Streptomyces sp. NPDC059373]
MNAGIVDANGLREVGGYSSLSDEEIERHAAVVAEELAQAGETIKALLPEGSASDLDWRDFRRANPRLPMKIENAWEIKFRVWMLPPSPSSRTTRSWSSPLPSFRLPAIPMIKTPDSVILRRGARRDALNALDERASQRLEDLEGEVERLWLTRNAIVKPKGLGIGLLILSSFTVVGVAVPVFIMSENPKDLTSGMAAAVWGGQAQAVGDRGRVVGTDRAAAAGGGAALPLSRTQAA